MNNCRFLLFLAAIGLVSCVSVTNVPLANNEAAVEETSVAVEVPSVTPVATETPELTVPSPTVVPTETATATQPIPTDTAMAPPAYTPNIPEISLSQCISTAVRDRSRLVGLWLRFLGPGRENEYERLFFRDSETVSIWRGGYALGLGHIAPWIRDATYASTNDRHIEVSIDGTAYASLDYGVCDDVLAVYNAMEPDVGVYGYVRLLDECWERADYYLSGCYFRLDS